MEVEQLEEWNEFANRTQGWRAEGLAAREDISVEEAQNQLITPISPIMFGNHNGSFAPRNGPGPYFPYFQQAPVVNGPPQIVLQNFDLTNMPGNYNTSFHKAYTERVPVLPASYDFWQQGEQDVRRPLFDAYMEANKDFAISYDDDPVCSSLFPGMFSVADSVA